VANEINDEQMTMKLGIMQPYFFPYLGYFQTIAASDEFVLYDQVKYVKKSWVDRNRLALGQDKSAVYFHPGSQRPNKSEYLIGELRLSEDLRWRRKLLKDIWHSYRKAAHFEEVYALVEELVLFESESVSAFNFNAVQKISKGLAIETVLAFNPPEFAAIEHNLEALVADYNLQDPALERHEVRVIEFCKAMGSDHFVNTIAGEHLYTHETMVRYGLDLTFVKSKPITYDQFPKGNFVPYLSVIDTLMHVGFAGAAALLPNYELIEGVPLKDSIK
jgi:hypothetical protein